MSCTKSDVASDSSGVPAIRCSTPREHARGEVARTCEDPFAQTAKELEKLAFLARALVLGWVAGHRVSPYAEPTEEEFDWSE